MNVGTIHVFDLDQTLVTCNSSYLFCSYLHKQGALSTMSMLKAFWFRMRHDLFSIDLQQLHNELFPCLLQGLSLGFLESFVEPFMRDCVLPNLYTPVYQELKMAQHSGAYIAIMSSSPSFIVKRVAEIFGVDEWLATEYRLDSENRLASVEIFIDGQAKADALLKLADQRKVPLARVSAYSDSYRDLPMLLLAGDPVAVNPDDKLRSHSLQHQWRLL